MFYLVGMGQCVDSLGLIGRRSGDGGGMCSD